MNQYYICWFLLLSGKIWYIIRINESEVTRKKLWEEGNDLCN